MHHLPLDVGSLRQRRRQADRDQLGRRRADVPAARMHRMPPGAGLRGHAEDRPLPEARLRQARSVLGGAMDNQSARASALTRGCPTSCSPPSRPPRSPPTSSESSKQQSDDWVRRTSSPPRWRPTSRIPAMIEEGKGLFESVGCKACHAIDPDQIGSPVGRISDFKAGSSAHHQGLRTQPEQDRREDRSRDGSTSG